MEELENDKSLIQKMLEIISLMKTLIKNTDEEIIAHPESAPHSSEGFVVRLDSDGEVKKSSSEERVSSSDAVDSNSSEEDDSLQEDFTHRMPMSPRGRK